LEGALAGACRVLLARTRARIPGSLEQDIVEEGLPLSFFQRNRQKLIDAGIDPARLPPGQYHTERFPVLHVGDVPRISRDDFRLRVFGNVANPVVLTFAELEAIGAVELTFDIHCVTKWSRFDTAWKGVRFRDLMDVVRPAASVQHVIEHAAFDYTTNVPFADCMHDDVLVAWEHGGEPLEPDHGGPVRMVVPHLYFWKSAKWLEGIELSDVDQPGFWERNGYHNYGDPFREQRYWGD
jgi:DMSO/TMAO reductase YedYZ molybdopterin-dependent catalytic subunit